MSAPSELLAYVHVMKTGGQTMCDILRQSFPGRHCDLQAEGVANADDLRFARRFYPGLRSVAGHGVVPLGDLGRDGARLRYFMFARDPVARCVSHYQYRRNKDERSDFEPWLERHANYVTRFLCRGREDRELARVVPDAGRAIEAIDRHVGFVGLQERFDESLVMLARWIGDPDFDPAYRARNVARATGVRGGILSDPRLVALIEEHHREDAKVHRHVLDVVYPRQVEAYGAGLDADVAAFRRRLPAPQARLLRRGLAAAKRGLLYKPLARAFRPGDATR
ncbi:MAG: hypothetical protein U1F08_09225 [Steroidobacteraceae bacterium]